MKEKIYELFGGIYSPNTINFTKFQMSCIFQTYFKSFQVYLNVEFS